eukprot:TRINITY_DN28910_c0_g2_i1.p1 TRINITY_DN28910_c0_g2~~TRINITY_DN28910_c0_g2_i1.p1  ORF type:complete len:145 (-),score=18.91 TRINITY_DN28910_c0_g2_i1:279-713(-)
MPHGEDQASSLEVFVGAGTDRFTSLYDCSELSDITVALKDGVNIAAHRVVLAAASDAFRAKCAAKLSDAEVVTWTPDVGTHTAWVWMLRWMYGYKEAMPKDSIVEILVIADYFQVLPVAKAILEFPGNTHTATARRIELCFTEY